METKNILIFVILFLMIFGSCFVVGIIGYFLTKTAPIETVSTEDIPPPVSFNLTNDTQANVNTIWEALYSLDADGVCLEKAREVAKIKKVPPSFVYSCSCASHVSSEEASYDCEVSAIDGAHSVQISCIKSAQFCAINSEIGESRVTFEEILSYLE